MVHPHNCAGTGDTMPFLGVDNSGDSGDKHLTHLTQVVDCCLKERSKQNMRVDGDKEDSADESVDS
eukprot:1305597-Ditylum_brightwellii.AAC.1